MSQHTVGIVIDNCSRMKTCGSSSLSIGWRRWRTLSHGLRTEPGRDRPVLPNG